jgi:hypothetical protein
MANGKIFNMILKTIEEVQKKNAANPKEPTADPTVFDFLKEKIGGLDKKIQQKRAEKGKPPVSILDMIKNQIEAAKQQNAKDPNVPTAPSSIFDKLNKKVNQGQKRQASVGVRRVIEEYNLDVSGLPRNVIAQIQQKYEAERKKFDHGFAVAINDLIKRS